MDTILNTLDFINNNYAINYAQNMSEKLTYKVKINDRYIRKDGTSGIYIQVFINKQKKIIPLDIAVKPIHFDKKKQRIKSNCNFANDYNLIIEKILADINKIEVNYRLSNESLTLKKFMVDLTQPSLRVCFFAFAEALLNNQLNDKVIRPTTHRAQKSQLVVVKDFKTNLLFSDITPDLINNLIAWLKNKRKYKKASIQSILKTFKKILHAANAKGINTKIRYNDIKVSSMKGEMVFLEAVEIMKLYKYYNSEFAPEAYKPILQKYLFCCFTGLRYSDVIKLTPDNIIGDYVAFTSQKTDKIQKVKLNSTALEIITEDTFFKSTFTNEHANRTLKLINTQLGFGKKLTFHTSRHTFATQFLIKGGQLQNLKHLLGHSKIETTMIYVHVVERLINVEVDNLDQIINLQTLN